MTRLALAAHIAPFLALGPLTGPLIAGIVFAARTGRPLTATALAALLGAWWSAVPVLVAHAIALSPALRYAWRGLGAL